MCSRKGFKIFSSFLPIGLAEPMPLYASGNNKPPKVHHQMNKLNQCLDAMPSRKSPHPFEASSQCVTRPLANEEEFPVFRVLPLPPHGPLNVWVQFSSICHGKHIFRLKSTMHYYIPSLILDVWHSWLHVGTDFVSPGIGIFWCCP